MVYLYLGLGIFWRTLAYFWLGGTVLGAGVGAVGFLGFELLGALGLLPGPFAHDAGYLLSSTVSGILSGGAIGTALGFVRGLGAGFLSALLSAAVRLRWVKPRQYRRVLGVIGGLGGAVGGLAGGLLMPLNATVLTESFGEVGNILWLEMLAFLIGQAVTLAWWAGGWVAAWVEQEEQLYSQWTP